MGTEVGRGGLVDERVDWNGMLPNHWIPQDPRMPSITLAHVIDDVFELVSGGASNADVIPALQGRPWRFSSVVADRIGWRSGPGGSKDGLVDTSRQGPN